MLAASVPVLKLSLRAIAMLASVVAQFSLGRRVAVLIGGLAILFSASVASACPFCAAPARTLSEDLAASDVVAFAKLLKKGNVGEDAVVTATDERGESTFEITTLVKGEQYVGKEKELKAFYFGDAKPGAVFFITGMALPEVKWNTPIPISSRGQKYLAGLPSLPEQGPERLAFFWGFLEDEDPLLAQDAYDEFARAPYKDILKMEDTLDRKQLIAWINSPDLAQSRRRLYFTLLGVCGKPADVPMLEDMMQSNDRRRKAGLDALIGCYLALKGVDGMPMVENLFLKKKDAEYSDTYAAIMSLRVMGQESDVIPRERLLEALHYMLERPDLADLVIPDLARWEDWDVMDRMVRLFKEANTKSNFVRVPVVNYLEAAARQKGPVGEKAKAAVSELEKIDPEAVKRAKAYAIFGPLAAPKKGPDSNTDKDPAEDSKKKADPKPALEEKTGAALTPETEEALATTNSDPAVEKTEDYKALITTVNDSPPGSVESSGETTAIQPLAAESQPLAAKSQPLAAKSQPLAAESQPRSSEPTTAASSPSGGRRIGLMLGMIVIVLMGLRMVSNRMKVAP